MNPDERVQAVYHGKVPDQVPLMLDLSHWYKKNMNVPFDLSGFTEVEQGLVDLHKQVGAVAYVEMGGFYSVHSEDPQVQIESTTADGVFSTRISTPVGTLHEERVFNSGSYSYGIRKHLLESTDDFQVVEFLMAQLQCRPKWELYEAWQNALGDLAYPYAQLPYSGSGYLAARNFGVEKTVYATLDEPERVHQLVDAVNACNLRILDACSSVTTTTAMCSPRTSSMPTSAITTRRSHTDCTRRASTLPFMWTVRVAAYSVGWQSAVWIVPMRLPRRRCSRTQRPRCVKMPARTSFFQAAYQQRFSARAQQTPSSLNASNAGSTLARNQHV